MTILSESEVLELSPYLTLLKRKGRLAPSRFKDLLTAASNRSPPLAPTDCCGSSCKPCVNELWKQEVRCWEECNPEGQREEEEEEEEVGEETNELLGSIEKAKLEDRRGTPDIEISIEPVVLLEKLSLAVDGLKLQT